MFYNKEMETMPRKELEKLQLEKLKKLAVYCYENVKLYKDKFDAVKLDPYKIKTLSDIQYIPYTTKADFRDNYPFNMFAVPMKKIIRLHASSGTTGKPTVVGYTKNDVEMWSECMARLVMAAGATDEDIVQICFGYGLFTGALGLHYGLEKLGATVIPSSSGNTEKQVMLMKDFGTTALVATPSYALRIGEVIEEMGIAPEDIKLRLGLFGSEGCTPEMRAQIESKLHLFATDNYGMSELIGPGVSGECTERCGMHFCEDHFLPEIINPETGEVLPEGENGELVITTLSKEALPVLRYRTRDLTSITYEPCKCGRTTARMMKPTGRTDDMLKIRGVNVFPSQIESVLMVIPEIAPYYQLVVGREGSADTLEVRVEIADAGLLDSYANLEALRKKVNHNLKTVLGIDTKVSLVEPKSIERTAGKAKRIIDNRPKESATFSVAK
ncbi:MAG: phenylacetate--CoA ligase family protein [Ruminiclostridium sp.]